MSTRTAERPSAPTPATTAPEVIGLSTTVDDHYRCTTYEHGSLPPALSINTGAPMASLIQVAQSRINLVARVLQQMSCANLDDVDLEPVFLLLSVQAQEADLLLEHMQRMDAQQYREAQS